jgi:hypothetical protein
MRVLLSSIEKNILLQRVGRFWHIAEKPTAPVFVGYWGNNRQRSEADIRNTKVPCLEKDQTMNLRSKIVPTPTTKKPRDAARGFRYLMPVGQNL